MKIFKIVLLITAAMAAGWLLREGFDSHSGTAGATSKPGERKILFYQSAMHPWVKSDKPGRCTICGMELTPVYEGDKGFDSSGGDVVALTQTQIQVLHVETAEVRTTPLTRTLMVAGMIDDNATRHRILSAYVDGRIDKLHVNFVGAEVKEGDPLAEFYSPTLLQAEREYRQLSGELKKNTGLRLRQMGLTQPQIDGLDKKAADSLTSQILSPISGSVVAQNVYEGQYVTAGEKLFEIADFSTMWFQFRAYEQDMPWIEPGQIVTVTTPSLPGKSFEGKVTFIDPNFDENTRSTKIRVELANPILNGRRVLLHRLYADGALKINTPSVLTIPRSAVIETGPEAVAYVDQSGGAYARTPIKLGRRGDHLIEIIDGLKAGEKVVTNGTLLIDGQAEMNRSFMTPVASSNTQPALAALEPAQKEAATRFIETADAMAAALAADDLAGFNKSTGSISEQTGRLVQSLSSIEGEIPALEELDKARSFTSFDDLQKARTAFHLFTIAATSVLEPLRNADGSPPFNIWECGMVDQAIPDAPKKARWIQLPNREGENPFFGKEMLNCAKEIKRGGSK